MKQHAWTIEPDSVNPKWAPNGAVVFDLDGTLVDTAEDIAFSVNFMRIKNGLLPLGTRDVLKAVGKGAGLLIQQMLRIEPTAIDKRNALLDEYRAHYRAHQGLRSKPYPGIIDAITRLSAFADLYVLSNKPLDATIREIEIAGLSHHFKSIWGGGSFPNLKPDPVGLHAAMCLSGTDSAHTIMVGDLFVDMETAARAETPSIFVSWGFGSIADIRHIPTEIVHSPNRLTDAISSILAR